jgi:hypothetical protein
MRRARGLSPAATLRKYAANVQTELDLGKTIENRKVFAERE